MQAPIVAAEALPGNSADLIPLNVYQGVQSTLPRKVMHLTRGALIDWLSKPQAVRSKEAAMAFTLASTKEGAGRRGKSEITSNHAVVGDIDGLFDLCKFNQGWAALAGLRAWAVAYQTYSSTPEAPRWRVVVLLDEGIAPTGYRAWWDAFNDLFGGMFDTNAKDAARLSYVCSHPAGETREVRVMRGGFQ